MISRKGMFFCVAAAVLLVALKAVAHLADLLGRTGGEFFYWAAAVPAWYLGVRAVDAAMKFGWGILVKKVPALDDPDCPRALGFAAGGIFGGGGLCLLWIIPALLFGFADMLVGAGWPPEISEWLFPSVVIFAVIIAVIVVFAAFGTMIKSARRRRNPEIIK